MFNGRSLMNVIWVGLVSVLFRENSFFFKTHKNLGKMTRYFMLSSIIKLSFYTEVKRHWMEEETGNTILHCWTLSKKSCQWYEPKTALCFSTFPTLFILSPHLHGSRSLVSLLFFYWNILGLPTDSPPNSTTSHGCGLGWLSNAFSA